MVCGHGRVTRSTGKVLAVLILITTMITPLSLATTAKTNSNHLPTKSTSNQQPETGGASVSITPTLLWKYTTNGSVESTPAVADLFGNGKLEVIVGSYDHNVYCLGIVNWSTIALGAILAVVVVFLVAVALIRRKKSSTTVT